MILNVDQVGDLWCARISGYLYIYIYIYIYIGEMRVPFIKRSNLKPNVNSVCVV